MVQAARSGKQNIVEAAAASTTSRGTELKLRRPIASPHHPSPFSVTFSTYTG